MNRFTRSANKRTIAAAAIFALFISLLALQANAPVTNAQAIGGFSHAIVELIPGSFDASGVFTPGGNQTISSVLSQSGSGAFLIQGVVVQNRVVSNCTPSGDLNTRFNFPPGGTGQRVGFWRMWGFRADGTGPLNAPTPPINSLTGGRFAVVNMSIDLEGFNGTIQLQGTLGRVFGLIESAGPSFPGIPTDILAITGGTGSFRSASGDATVTPLIDSNRNNCANGAFQVALKEAPKPPRFGNVIP